MFINIRLTSHIVSAALSGRYKFLYSCCNSSFVPALLYHVTSRHCWRARI